MLIWDMTLRPDGSSEVKVPTENIYGRKQQVYIEIYGAIIGIIIVMLFANMTLGQGLIPASSTTFATTCQAVANPELIKTLLIFAIPGAIVQLVGGKHMIGVLFATGLVINSPIYGIGVLVTTDRRIYELQRRWPYCR